MLFIAAIGLNGSDREKLTRLYNLYSRKLFTVAKSVVHNDYDAEDVLQEAFIRIANHIDKIDDTLSDKTLGYLVIVTRNAAIDLVRKQKRADVVGLDTDFVGTPSNDAAVDDIICDKMSVNDIVDCLRELPEIYIDVLTLALVEELSTEEISAVLGKKRATVQKQLQRGRAMLAQKISEVYADE